MKKMKSIENTIKTIAFVLPQFHAIPENDEWWGKGFTEWVNVKRGKPNFTGHYQPHVPAGLNYYSLLNPKTRAKQASLAKKHGVYGFCYHHYWFGGKELLQKPIMEILKTGKPDFPFCICWANENWTRSWDGKDKEILIKQDHSVKNDNSFIDHLLEVFEDERYIKVNGKPLLLIYKISLLADPRKTISYWRKCCEDSGLNGLYVCAVDHFIDKTPEKYGVDAFVEFAPHGLHDKSMDCGDVIITNPSFRGSLRDMESVVLKSLLKKSPVYTYYRGVMPSWDNTARRQDSGVTFVNSSPALFEFWYHEIVKRIIKSGEKNKLVFVNAWNEWAEGCHLEPDKKYGTSFLKVSRFK